MIFLQFSNFRYFIFIKFISNFTDNFFYNILYGNKSRCTAIFIHKNRNMHSLFLHFYKKIMNRDCFNDANDWVDKGMNV